MAESPVKKTTSADEAAMAALVPAAQREDLEIRVRALLARNTTLAMIEKVREEARLSKKELAEEVEMDASALRKLLTSADANPTSDSLFRLFAALGIHLEGVTPSGARFHLT